MITEADTCRKYVLPKLFAAGWDNDPPSFTAGQPQRVALQAAHRTVPRAE
ncbi:MAG TPA: hypothetical protein VGX03_24695 [Candidatus Binatia bacterium]|nr:hypothetical protein [Candidatus Binatia bacterium]